MRIYPKPNAHIISTQMNIFDGIQKIVS